MPARPRLLIIGAAGFVGSRLALAAAGHYEVLRGQRRVERGAGVLPGDVIEIDLADRSSIVRALDGARPAAVALTAAMADIDHCEREQALAEAINLYGAVEVARICAERGLRLLFTSTDAVFDGKSPPYDEDSPPSPLNFYASTKARAEAAIAQTLPSAAIVRLSLVLGRSAVPDTNSYVDKLAANLAAGRSVTTPSYEWRNPIDVGTLCMLLLELLESADARGIIHAGAVDKIDRVTLARGLATALGCDPELIVAQHEPLPGRAPRGRDSFLATTRTRQLCRTPLPSCAEAIERAVTYGCGGS